MKISLAMIIKNEEDVLERCLNSAKDLVDEIIVVDTGSTDKSRSIAEKMGAKVFDFEWCDDFSEARNYALSKCTGDWNLVLDADESICDGNKNDLIDFANNNPGTVGNLTIINKFESNGEVTSSKSHIARFASKEVRFSGAIHEQFGLIYPKKDTKITINHTGYLNKNKSERNLKLLFNELDKNPNDDYVLYQIARSLYNDKKYADSIEYFKMAYKLTNKSAPYFKNMIITYMYNIINLKEPKNYEIGLAIIDEEEKYFLNSPDFYFVCGVFFMELVLYDMKKYVKYLDYIEQSYSNCLNLGDNEECIVEGTGSFKAAYNLGVLYETLGYKDNAKEYYKIACDYGYKRAEERLKVL